MSTALLVQFQSFVRPQRHPRLSAYCRRLTGISQDDVHAAPALDAVLRGYKGWLREQGVVGPDGSHNVLYVTVGKGVVLAISSTGATWRCGVAVTWCA
jgi:inhibitor of KinA sporulation pathway (predicted exonuclease)